jgi:hypothetical protein
MGSQRLPSEEEINTANDQGKQAVAALFYDTFKKMDVIKVLYNAHQVWDLVFIQERFQQGWFIQA